jgi:SpoVK/Ycf46/Vps4 family AAA+-type ATPase
MRRDPIPILNPNLQAEIDRSIVMFEKKTLWKELGMDRLREQGAALLFYGPPGTGKTITAKHIAKRLNMFIANIDFSQIGSDTPGELARNIKKLFAHAAIQDLKGNQSLVFIDECDTVLVARNRLGHDNLWMLEPINAMLQEIGQYRGLVILATNMKPDFLDHALERRLLGQFEFGVPDYLTRCQIWEQKFPRKLPIKPNELQLKFLGLAPLNGAQIETHLINWISDLMVQGLNTRQAFKEEGIKQLLDQIDQLIPTHPEIPIPYSKPRSPILDSTYQPAQQGAPDIDAFIAN